MGAETDETVIIDKGRKALEDQYKNVRDQRAYDHGHGGYSGTFAEATGLFVHHGQEPFPTKEAARDWLDERVRKWGPAQAVRFRADDGVACWYVMALCSS